MNSVRLDTLDACSSLPVALKGGFTFNPKHPETIALDKLNLQLGDIPIGFDGRVSIARDSIVSELQCTIRPLALERAITLVPPQLMPMLRAFDTNLAFDLHTRIDGSYRFSDGRLPRIDLDVTTNDGYLSYKNAKARIDRFGIDASLRYDPQRPDSTGAVFRKLDIAGSGIRLHGSGSVWNAMRDPAVRMKLTGAVYLDTLSILFPSKQDIAVRGRLGLNTDASFRISQLQIGKIGKTRVEGTITLDSLLVDIPRDTIFMMVGGGMIHFGSDPQPARLADRERCRDAAHDRQSRHVKPPHETAVGAARIGRIGVGPQRSIDAERRHDRRTSAERPRRGAYARDGGIRLHLDSSGRYAKQFQHCSF